MAMLTMRSSLPREETGFKPCQIDATAASILDRSFPGLVRPKRRLAGHGAMAWQGLRKPFIPSSPSPLARFTKPLTTAPAASQLLPA